MSCSLAASLTLGSSSSGVRADMHVVAELDVAVLAWCTSCPGVRMQLAQRSTGDISCCTHCWPGKSA